MPVVDHSCTPFFSSEENIPALIRRCAQERPDHVYCTEAGRPLTCLELDSRTSHLAQGLLEAGVVAGSRVAVMLAHHVEHALVFFALAKIGAINVPVNVHLKGAGLEHVLRHSQAQVVIAESDFSDVLQPLAIGVPALRWIWRGEVPDLNQGALSLDRLHAHRAHAPLRVARDDDLRAILYTSGTTGPAKGVQMTDRMFRAAALSSIWVGDIQPGSCLHFWDPIYHVFGSEVLVLALMQPVTLAFVPRFSASRFWKEVSELGITHLHFVGGVLQLLLKQPFDPLERRHRVRIAWGGGAPLEVWQAFEQRFGIPLRDGYGMTETSSFSIINREGKAGSIGRPVDYFEAEIVNYQGDPVPAGTSGEIRIRGKERDLITRGYYRDLEKTAEALRDGWLYTGDLGRQDEQGYFYFLGRKKDSLRRRGENISAWEVENVINDHPLVEECALIGVSNEFADEDLKIFLRLRPQAAADDFEHEAFAQWCSSRMARFQIPRFIALVDSFPKTPTQRIQKHLLPRGIDDCWDMQRWSSAS